MDQSNSKKISQIIPATGPVRPPSTAKHVTNPMPAEELKILIERIGTRMAALGTNAKQVSRLARLGNTAVYDIVNGKNLRPALPTIKAIAKSLDCDLAYLVGDQTEPRRDITSLQGVEPIPVIGVAEAGAFRNMMDFDQDLRDVQKIQANRSIVYPKARHFALLVRGDSMNAAKPISIVEGVYLLCVDLIDAELEIESGKIYAVRRTTDGGQTYECTVKRAMVYRDRYELIPESANPSHEKLVIPRGHGQGDAAVDTAINVIGLVYGLYSSLESLA